MKTMLCSQWLLLSLCDELKLHEANVLLHQPHDCLLSTVDLIQPQLQHFSSLLQGRECV